MDRKKVVLYVDDSPDSLALIRRWLEQAGYQVVTASSASAAVHILDSVSPDAILLDALMPGMDGYTFCQKLQEIKELASVPVIFLTALYTRQDKARALAAGAVDFLVKPVRQQRLVETIQKHVEVGAKWSAIHTRTSAGDLRGFLTSLQKSYNVVEAALLAQIEATTPETVYALAPKLGLTEAQLAQRMAEYLNLKFIPQLDLGELELGVLPTSFCKARHVVPITDEGTRAFAVDNPFVIKLIDDISALFESGDKPRIVVTARDNIQAIFAPPAEKTAVTISELAGSGSKLPTGRHDAAHMQAIEAQLSGIYKKEEEKEKVDADATEESAPVIRLVNRIIDNAYTMGASDIHVEPWENEVVIRYRIDGDLRPVSKLQPLRLINPIVARIKIMSNLSITERRLPQDGRIVYKDGVDLRVATSPTNYGEKVVMRLLDKKKSAQPLNTLGFSERNLKLYREKIQSPYGMVLHVGPTGSGKSMTLFAALKEIQTPEINIQTIEDPIEYTLQGISQVQVNLAAGLTFARGLRSFLRQDPDVVLVGEIRDKETADTAVEAALTGHLLLSTLHTNDSATTVTRLIEMGIEPYMVSSSIIMICAQRLLRRLCPKCKRSHQATPDEKRLAGAEHLENFAVYGAAACPECGDVGYKGRIGVHEIMVMSDALRAAMTKHGISADELKRMAVEQNDMTTLYWDGIDKVRSGVTSLKEVVAQIRQDDFDSRPAWVRA